MREFKVNGFTMKTYTAKCCGKKKTIDTDHESNIIDYCLNCEAYGEFICGDIPLVDGTEEHKIIVEKCPYCGEKHVHHGNPYISTYDFLAHCGKGTYIIKVR